MCLCPARVSHSGESVLYRDRPSIDQLRWPVPGQKQGAPLYPVKGSALCAGNAWEEVHLWPEKPPYGLKTPYLGLEMGRKTHFMA